MALHSTIVNTCTKKLLSNNDYRGGWVSGTFSCGQMSHNIIKLDKINLKQKILRTDFRKYYSIPFLAFIRNGVWG